MGCIFPLSQQQQPTPLRSASPAYHMFSSLPTLPTFKKKTCWAECMQGARTSNEDEFFTFPLKQYDKTQKNSDKVGFFGVHDGHAGIIAVNILQEMLTAKWYKYPKKNEPWEYQECMADDANVLWLANSYKHASMRLNGQFSGVVSISALVVENKAIYFAWIGDCEGCLFLNDADLVDPVFKKGKGITIEEIDFASPTFINNNCELLGEPCATSPHSLLGSVSFKFHDQNNSASATTTTTTTTTPTTTTTTTTTTTNIVAKYEYDYEKHKIYDNKLKEVKSSDFSIFPKPIKRFLSMEVLRYYFEVIPVHFENPKAEKEYNMVQRHFPDAKLLDVAIQRVGTSQIFSDVRISKSTQPTRTIGDYRPLNQPILPIVRDPVILRITLQDFSSKNNKSQKKNDDDDDDDDESDSSSSSRSTNNNKNNDNQDSGSSGGPKLNVLLCSDGVFSEHAFADIKSVCRFVVNPVAFFRESFYARGQTLTERLIAAEFLPENLLEHQPQDFLCLYKRWVACRTWSDILVFLREHHYLSISSKKIKSMLSSQDMDSYISWLKVCKDTIRWLEFNSFVDHLSLDNAVKLATRLAIIMGSTDNVTIVVAQAYSTS